MIKLKTFCIIYHGQKVDFDGACGAQCVDLFRQYNKDVWGNPRLEGLGENGGAKDLWLKYDQMPLTKKYLCKVTNPVCGDVVVFGATPTNKFGHVAIFLAQKGNDILVFEQNGYTQDGAKYAWRSTQGMLGALRKR